MSVDFFSSLRSLFASSADKKSDATEVKLPVEREVEKIPSLISSDFCSRRAAFEEKFRAYQKGMAQWQKKTDKEQ